MTRADVVVVGAGMQGATLALEAARRGRRVALVDRGAPGGGATGASFGLVHGGLRHLQRLDVAQWLRSRAEQSWFLRTLPDHVQPLPCLMPLYRGTPRSPALFRAAFVLERAIASIVATPPALPASVLLGVTDTLPDYPLPRDRLVGAARWSEAVLGDPGAAVEALLGAAVRRGATVLRETEAHELIVEDGVVAGLRVRAARRQGSDGELRAPLVVLCAGAAARGLARRFDRDLPALSCATLAFNLLLDLRAPPGVALGVSPVPGRGRSLFLRGHAGGTLAGTWYAPWTDGRAPDVPETMVEQALAELARCLPALPITRARLREVWGGVLPDTDGSGRRLRRRDVSIDHARHGGPLGLHSLLGTKLSTARALSERLARRLWPDATASRTPCGGGGGDDTVARPRSG